MIPNWQKEDSLRNVLLKSNTFLAVEVCELNSHTGGIIGEGSGGTESFMLEFTSNL